MKRLVALYFGWLALIVGCGGRTLEDGDLAGPAGDPPATENGVTPVYNPGTLRLAPITVAVPSLTPISAVPIEPIVTPPIETPPTETPPAEPVPPFVIKGSTSCEEVFGATASETFRLEGRLKDGTYELVGRDVTMSFDQISILELSSTAEIIGVIVKGTDDANAYTLSGMTAKALVTPDGSPIGYVAICYAP